VSGTRRVVGQDSSGDTTLVKAEKAWFGSSLFHEERARLSVKENLKRILTVRFLLVRPQMQSPLSNTRNSACSAPLNQTKDPPQPMMSGTDGLYDCLRKNGG
jgi:hypothetical protein